MKLEKKYYTIAEVAKMLSTTKHYIWILVSLCKNCGKSYGTCTCGHYETRMKAINIGSKNNKRKTLRIPHSEIVKRLEKYNPKIKNGIK